MQKLLQPESKRAIRSELNELMADYLAKGGKIKDCNKSKKGPKNGKVEKRI
jgi:hypothetical protein